MAGKHDAKKTTASSRAASTTARRGRSGDNVYVVTPEYSDTDWESYQKSRSKKKTAARKEKNGSGKARWLLLIPAAAVAAAAIWYGSVLVSAERIAHLDTIYPNILVNGIDVGELTVEEAVQKLADGGLDPYRGKSLRVRFPLDHDVTVTAEELGLGSDVTYAAEAAYAYGRDGTLMENRKTYRACKGKITPMLWEPSPVMDETALHDKILAAAGEVNASLLDTSAEIGEEGVTLVKGMNAEKVDGEAVYEQVRQAFQDQVYDDIVVELVELDADGKSEEADEEFLQSVYDAIFKEPVNAMYDKQTGGVTEGEPGVSFDMEEARRLWAAAEPGEEIFIPFIFTDPDVKDLDGMFEDCLAEKSTSLSGSSSARINNITLAAQAMNGTVLNPGETFDYNSCLGQRTAARGYQEAGAYSAGKHVSELGGGICQGSSTLYYCAMKANLNITVRSNHYFVVGYLPWGMDATVSWGGPDFRFVNNRDYPIKIRAWVADGYLTVQIWGTDVDGSHVELTNDTWEDDEYYYAQTYRTVYAADGTVISSAREAYSQYHKYEEGEETPAPVTPTPEPTDTTPEAEPTATSFIPEQDPDPEPEADPDPEPVSDPEPEPDPVPESEPDPIGDTGTGGGTETGDGT